MSGNKTQLAPLTGFRFFLAMWVVIFHQRFLEGYQFALHFPTPVVRLLEAGYMAVGVFFILSGFVLSYNYNLEKRWQAREIRKYGLARFARIYPAYGLALLLSAPSVFAMLRQAVAPVSFQREFVKAATVWTLTQAWSPVTAEAWNVPAWSLSNEAFFYCVFPFLGVVLWKARTWWYVLALTLGVWTISVLLPMAAVLIPLRDALGAPAWLWDGNSRGDWVTFLKFFPLFHVPEFCAGILAGRLFSVLRDRNSQLSGRGYWLYLPGLAMEAAAIVKWEPTLFPFLHDGVLLPLHVLVILGFALDGGWLAKMLATRSFVLLGNASYSIYIFQSPVGGWMYTIAKHVFSTKLWGWGAAGMYMLVLTCFSIITFVFVEEPANRVIKRRIGSLFGISSPQGDSMAISTDKAALISTSLKRATITSN